MSGIFSSPSPPAQPPLPPAPPVRSGEEARRFAEEERKRRLRAGGRQSTILTGGLGVSGNSAAGSGGNELLGQ